MGWLGKALAVRWISQGRGGGGGDGDAGLVLLVFAAVMGATFLVVVALGRLYDIVTSTLYSTLRPILIVSPRASVIVGGIAIAGMLALMPKYPPETAKAVLINEESDDTDEFYIKGAFYVGLLLLTTYLAVVKQTGFITSLFASYVPHPIFHGIINTIWAFIFLYLIFYKVFHLPYRCHRLLGHAPFGRAISVVTLFPLTAMVVIGGFDLSLGFTYPVTARSAFAVSSAILLSVHALPILLVKLLAEKRILQLEVDSQTGET